MDSRITSNSTTTIEVLKILELTLLEFLEQARRVTTEIISWTATNRNFEATTRSNRIHKDIPTRANRGTNNSTRAYTTRLAKTTSATSKSPGASTRAIQTDGAQAVKPFRSSTIITVIGSMQTVLVRVVEIVLRVVEN